MKVRKISLFISSLCLYLVCISMANAEFIVRPEKNIFEGTSIIPVEAFEKEIAQTLQERGIPGERININLQDFAKGISLQNYDQSYYVRLLNFKILTHAKRFEATYRFSPQEKTLPPETVTIKGTFDTFVTVPVLVSPKGKGSVIEEEDLVFIEVSSNNIQRGTILESQDIIGKEVKSPAAALQLIRKYQLTEPRIIAQNDIVDIVYNSSTLQLRTLGTALEHGGKGEVIRVKNNASNQTIQAVIVGKNLVQAQRNTTQNFAFYGAK